MPAIYPGRLTLFMCTEDSSRSAKDSRLAWGRVATDGLEVRVLPGNHLSVMKEPLLKNLADQLTTVIDKPSA
jgi:thioesterase domain-containing protein